MKQLPGRARPKWLAVAGQVLAAALFVAMTVSVLPVLLMTSLVTALILIPVLRQLRKEAERTGSVVNVPAREQMVDITPLHERLRQEFSAFRRRGWRR
jgi:hypothetical protein